MIKRFSNTWNLSMWMTRKISNQTFSPNPYFEDTKLTKVYSFSGDEVLKVKATSIMWKKGMDIANDGAYTKKGDERILIDESFFTWFNSEKNRSFAHGAMDEVGDIIREDLWPNPLKYFNNEFEEEFELVDDDDEEIAPGAGQKAEGPGLRRVRDGLGAKLHNSIGRVARPATASVLVPPSLLAPAAPPLPERKRSNRNYQTAQRSIHAGLGRGPRPRVGRSAAREIDARRVRSPPYKAPPYSNRDPARPLHLSPSTLQKLRFVLRFLFVWLISLRRAEASLHTGAGDVRRELRRAAAVRRRHLQHLPRPVPGCEQHPRRPRASGGVR